jgi:hypothetical protein
MYLPGYAAKLVWNGARLAFASLTIEEQVDNVRTTNSEGYNGAGVPGGAPTGGGGVPGRHTSINGNGCLTLTVNLPSFDITFNPYVTYTNVLGSFFAGGYAVVQVLLNGPGSVSWACGSFHILSTGQNIDAQGTQGMPLFVRGEGNGTWAPPFI